MTALARGGVRGDDAGKPLNSALLPGEAQASRTGEMSFYSAVFNLSNTILGSGALTMPFAFAQFGWLPANVVASVVLITTTYSVYLLVVASDRVGQGLARSFETLGYYTCGIFGATYAQATFMVGGVGTLTGYFIFIGTLVAQVVGLSQEETYIPILSIGIFIILPLTWPRKINTLRYASILAVAALLYVVVLYCVFYFKIGATGKFASDNVSPMSGSFQYNEPVMLHLSLQSVTSLNLLIGAFCVQNTCLPVHGEIKNGSPRRTILAVLTAMVLCYCIYELIGLSGYLVLGGDVSSDSLLDFDNHFVDKYPWAEIWVDAAKLSMALLLSLSVPLAIWPCRSAFCSVISRATRGCTGDVEGSDQASDLMFRGVTVGILATVSFLAVVTPDVSIPLSLVNSIAGGSMILIMPGMFYVKSMALRPEGAEATDDHRIPAYCMVAIGVVVAIIGCSLQVASIKQRFFS